jgi:3-oxoacyl-[acyl-carrier-protein] synthase-3
MIKSRIISAGSYLPEKIYDNKYMESLVDTSNEWIIERTGIRERHIAAVGELTSDLALRAAIDALLNSNVSSEDIDAIILATTTPDRTFPSTATILQNKLGIGDSCFAFDVQAVCCGFIYALDIADAMVVSGKAKNVLVIGAETLSKIVNWKDRNTCVLFGDGAGAVILQAHSDGDSGILATSLHSDGQYFDILKTSGGVSFNQQAGFIEMEGREVFKIAVNKMSECVLEAISKVNLTMEDIDLLIPHQANQRIIDGVAKKLHVNADKVVSTVALHANTSGASIPLAIDYAVKNNKVRDGDIVILEGLGGGLTWGSVVLKW